ncbi:MAG: hypothetical protein WC292_02150 [Clostridia bacterium]
MMDYSPFYFKNFYEKKPKKAKRGSYTSPLHAEAEKGKLNNDLSHNSGENMNGQGGMDGRNGMDGRSGMDGRGGMDGRSGMDGRDGISEKSKKKGDKTGLFATIIILLCFLCVVVASDFLSGGAIVAGLKTTFNPNQGVKYYFLCVGEYDTELKAITHADAVRKKGGAGYIHINNNRYYVVIATFLDKKSANTVQGKNEGTKIFELETKEIKLAASGTKERALANKVRDKLVEGVRELYLYANALDAGESEHSEVMDKLSNLRNEFLYLKEEIAVGTMIASDKIELFRIIDPMYGGLDALFYETSGDFLSAALRNIMAGTVTALCYSPKQS